MTPGLVLGDTVAAVAEGDVAVVDIVCGPGGRGKGAAGISVGAVIRSPDEMAAEDLRDFHPNLQEYRLRGLASSFFQFKSLIGDAQLLHVLATRPSAVLPPGKRIGSIFPDASTLQDSPNKPSTLSVEERVSEIVHKAFWAEALEALSAGQSAPIISRLSRLYDDMHRALVPVLSSSNPVMITVSSPLPPTSSPLRSSRNFLQNVLGELRKCCAAARDAEVDTMLNDLSASFNLPDDEQDGRLPSLIIQTIRSIFTLAQEMTSDLRNFTLANLTERDVMGLITSEARRREVECVTRLYGGQLGVLRTWDMWLQSEAAALDGTPVEEIALKSQEDMLMTAKNWKKRLLGALSTPVPISIVAPPMTELPPEPGALPPESGSEGGESSRKENELPAVFLVSVPSLFRIQNLFQAIVITACLRLLVRSAGSDAADKEADIETFTSRIWIILRGEVEGHEQRAGHEEADGADTQLRLANLEDEVWQLVRKRFGTGSATSSTRTSDVPLLLAREENVRANVRRLLRTEDPVFTLIMRRLVLSFEKWFEAIDETEGTTEGMLQDGAPNSGLSHVPSLMKTGRALPWSNGAPTFSRSTNALGGGPTPHKDSESIILTHGHLLPETKGFEGDVLRGAFESVAGEMHSVTSWIEETWGDTLMIPPPSSIRL